ncbi:MAG: DUF1080 domain-containing protein [Pirellulaceae bacterium]|jgi:hypothetical protein
MRSLIFVLACCTLATCSSPSSAQDKTEKKSAAVEDGFTAIFNGSDLSGWKGNADLWSVEDGSITGRTTAEAPLKFNTFLIYEVGPVADFELRLDYKIKAGNSGIQYRSQIIEADKFIVGGYQADIDATSKYTGINYEERGRGILAERGQRVTIAADGAKSVEDFADREELAKEFDPDGWNHYRVVAKGNRLSHYINDVLMSEVIDNQESEAEKSGVLAFQVHQGPPMVVRFKNIRIKTLD